VPAAAVIHEWRALSVLIGRIGCVGGKRSYTPLKWLTGMFITPFYLNILEVVKIHTLVIKYGELMRFSDCEGKLLFNIDTDTLK
jgi:hypothetical protein